MNQPPIPPIPESQGRSCPNCGQSVAPNAQRCANCGMALATASSPSVWKVLGACVLGLLALVLGAMGACFMAFGAMGVAAGDFSLAFIGLLLSGSAALCVWGVILLTKR